MLRPFSPVSWSAFGVCFSLAVASLLLFFAWVLFLGPLWSWWRSFVPAPWLPRRLASWVRASGCRASARAVARRAAVVAGRRSAPSARPLLRALGSLAVRVFWPVLVPLSLLPFVLWGLWLLVRWPVSLVRRWWWCVRRCRVRLPFLCWCLFWLFPRFAFGFAVALLLRVGGPGCPRWLASLAARARAVVLRASLASFGPSR